MRYQRAIITLYFGLVASYACWKGNAAAITHTQYVNSKGEVVFPVVAKSMEQASAVGGAMYYTGAEGQVYTDISSVATQHFNWEAFFKVVSFGFGLALLIVIIVRMSAHFAKENELK